MIRVEEIEGVSHSAEFLFQSSIDSIDLGSNEKGRWLRPIFNPLVMHDRVQMNRTLLVFVEDLSIDVFNEKFNFQERNLIFSRLTFNEV